MYLVTGGAGFIGSNVVASLSERGEKVIVCDSMGRDDRWQNIAKHNVTDIVLPTQLHDWLTSRGGNLRGIVHMGAISSTTEIDVDLIVKQNIRFTLDLWRWCIGAGTPLIYASSAATYGDGDSGFDDDFSSSALARLRPLNAYGWSKNFVDKHIANVLASGEPTPPQWVGLKFFNVYGPNEYHKGAMKSVVAQNFARVRNGEPIRLFRSYRSDYPDGGQLRDFIYVRDCVDAILWLLDNPNVSGLFNLGTGKARSWLDLAKGLFAALERELAVEFFDMPEEIRPRYQYFTEARMQRLKEAGYDHPFTSLEDGVADYVRHFLMASDPYR